MLRHMHGNQGGVFCELATEYFISLCLTVRFPFENNISQHTWKLDCITKFDIIEWEIPGFWTFLGENLSLEVYRMSKGFFTSTTCTFLTGAFLQREGDSSHICYSEWLKKSIQK